MLELTATPARSAGVNVSVRGGSSIFDFETVMAFNDKRERK